MKSVAGATLRSLSLPRFALRRDEVAASLAISPSRFDNWRQDGLMPAGRKIGGVVLIANLVGAGIYMLSRRRKLEPDS